MLSTISRKSLTIYVTHATAFDFETNLYIPLKQSQLNLRHKIILPHESNLNSNNSKEIIRQSDLVLAEVSHPSTGQGIELGWANLFNIPTICLFQEHSIYSRSLNLISNTFISYQNNKDLIIKIEALLFNY